MPRAPQDRRLPLAAALLAVALLGGCNLLNVEDTEGAHGRGPLAFDPYMGKLSGAVRLTLQTFNGCAINPMGQPFGKGALNVAIPYPDKCQDPAAKQPATTLKTPAGPMPILAGYNYFLNEITLSEIAVNLHTDPTKLDQPFDWIKTQTVFKGLDWSGVNIGMEEWLPSRNYYSFEHTILLGNAAWQLNRADYFDVEVDDADGNAVAGNRYDRKDFLAENPIGGHTQFGYWYTNVAKPLGPGNNTVKVCNFPDFACPTPMGADAPPPASYITEARLDLNVSANPWKQLQLDANLQGDGFVKVTWSQLPDNPFYFPVSFKHQEDLTNDCWDHDDPTIRVPCSFGVKTNVLYSRPQNGSYYVPGETFEFRFELMDAEGHLLHPPDSIPSMNDAIAGKANGILYYWSPSQGTLREKDIGTVIKVLGPLQKLRPPYQPAWLEETPYFQFPGGRGYMPSTGVIPDQVYGIRDIPGPSTFPVTLPQDATSGTYLTFIKLNRYFMGEKQTRTTPFYFQVGQADRTFYPQRVGNCQICHRGAITLDNVQMGLPEDDTEGCIACHNAQITGEIHQTHGNSAKWPRERRDCATCHLTRESALRPSIQVCSACHPAPHGIEFWDQELTSYDWSPEPNRESECGVQCHVKSPPTQHILPER